MSAYAGSCSANFGSFFSSSAWKRRFSRRSSSPGRSRFRASDVPSPRASPVTGTFLPMSCVRRSATGRSRSPSWTLPPGRPRWLARMTFAPWLRRCLIVGMAARIRESSVILPSSRGTLKSTRTKTRFPATSTSRIVSLSIYVLPVCVRRWATGPSGRLRGNRGRELRRDHLDQVGASAAVTPLVVVPGDHLHEVPAEDHRARRVYDRGARVAPEVRRDERLVRHAEDPGHRAGGRGAERCVELLDRGVAGDGRGEVDDAHGGRRDAEAEAVELALEVRDDQGERLRGAGGGRDDVQPGSASATRVLVRDVQDPLIVRVRVDRVHEATLDADEVVSDLHGWGQAVRRATRVADDVVGSRVVLLIVDAQDDRDVLTLGRGTDDDLLRPPAPGGA